MTRRSPLAIALALVSIGLLAAAGSAELWAPASQPAAIDPVVTVADPRSARLACPPGVLDSFDPQSPGAPASIWSSTGLGASDTAPSTLSAHAESGTLELPTAIVVAGQGGGDLIGLSTTGCAVPSASQWILLGPTSTGNDPILLLSNPSDTPSEVTIRGYGASGPLDETPHLVTVPANSSITVLPVGWYADEERLALEITADGPGVAAFAQISRMSGETPRGTTWTSGLDPHSSILLLGLGGETSANLRIAVPGDEAAKVVVRTVTSEGTSPLNGGELQIDARTVLDVPVTGVSAEPIALEIDSDVPVIASVDQSWDGASWPGTDASWGIASALRPSRALDSAPLPGASELAEIAAAQLDEPPLRPTLLESETESGSGQVHARLLLVLPADSEAPSAEVTIAGERATLAAGTALLVELPAVGGELSSSAPIRAAVLLDAQTPNGTLRASWPVGTTGLLARESEVLLGP